MSEIKNEASAIWKGSLKDGNGTFSVKSNAFESTAYTFASRFQGTEGTNPEELIAASHAACFSMALSAQLTENDHPPTSIETTATLTMRKNEAGFAIEAIHLKTNATVPGISLEKFSELAGKAKDGCPISTLLAPGLQELTLDASLDGH